MPPEAPVTSTRLPARPVSTIVSRMFAGRRLHLDPGLERRDARAGWIAWARAAAVPFVLLEVALERGNYPSGDERLAWALAAAFVAGPARRPPSRAHPWGRGAGVAPD